MFNSIDACRGLYSYRYQAGACTLTASVTVADEPSIIAAGNNNTLCIGAAIQLSSTCRGTSPYASFAWTGPDNLLPLRKIRQVSPQRWQQQVIICGGNRRCRLLPGQQNH